MCEVYEIMLGNHCIGTAEVKREGLYYCFHCRCKLSGEIMYQLTVKCGTEECSLGLFIPVGNEFGIDTRLPIKKIGNGNLSFCVVPRHQSIRDKFVPICADEPFLYLEKLQRAHLDIQNGALGITILEDSDDIN